MAPVVKIVRPVRALAGRTYRMRARPVDARLGRNASGNQACEKPANHRPRDLAGRRATRG